ncbi:MAG: hypothetical protein UU47_C0005G0008 [candidate division TM6 bacterium GW2011_GWE2_41_16]|nr:MAG: hypothetical protein UU47_C0005G0008 [candidate division TM6 bacterium GW2011_GWE2_41_16]
MNSFFTRHKMLLLLVCVSFLPLNAFSPKNIFTKYNQFYQWQKTWKIYPYMQKLAEISMWGQTVVGVMDPLTHEFLNAKYVQKSLVERKDYTADASSDLTQACIDLSREVFVSEKNLDASQITPRLIVKKSSMYVDGCLPVDDIVLYCCLDRKKNEVALILNNQYDYEALVKGHRAFFDFSVKRALFHSKRFTIKSAVSATLMGASTAVVCFVAERYASKKMHIKTPAIGTSWANDELYYLPKMARSMIPVFVAGLLKIKSDRDAELRADGESIATFNNLDDLLNIRSIIEKTYWRHQWELFSTMLSGGISARPVMKNFTVMDYIALKRFSDDIVKSLNPREIQSKAEVLFERLFKTMPTTQERLKLIDARIAELKKA